MKAILIQKDKSLVWADVPDPVVKPEDVLVKIQYAALNRADLLQREGNYPPPPGAPEWMGLEVAGTIAAVGEGVSGWAAGDKACALLGGGGYAEYVSVPAGMLMPVPEGLSVTEAAALPEAFATAWLNLFHEGGLKAGDTLLITAGASGLASVMIPMAKAFGAYVITTVHKAELAEAIRPLGADVIVNTENESLPEVLKAQAEAGHSVTVAVDCLGGAVMGQCLPYLTHGARWIMIATLAGDLTEVNLRTVYVRNVRIIGSTLRSRTQAVKEKLLAELVENVWPHISAGPIRPTISAVLPVTEADAAHQRLYSGNNAGKVVLTVE